MLRAKARLPLTAVYINFRLTCIQYNYYQLQSPFGFSKNVKVKRVMQANKQGTITYLHFLCNKSFKHGSTDYKMRFTLRTTKGSTPENRLEEDKRWYKGRPGREFPTPDPTPRFCIREGKASKVGLTWLLGNKTKNKQTNKLKGVTIFWVHLNSFNTKALYMSFYSFCPLPHPQCPRFTLITGHLSLKKVKIGSNSWISRLPLWVQRNKDVITDRSSKAGCYGSKQRLQNKKF